MRECGLLNGARLRWPAEPAEETDWDLPDDGQLATGTVREGVRLGWQVCPLPLKSFCLVHNCSLVRLRDKPATQRGIWRRSCLCRDSRLSLALQGQGSCALYKQTSDTTSHLFAAPNQVANLPDGTWSMQVLRGSQCSNPTGIHRMPDFGSNTFPR